MTEKTKKLFWAKMKIWWKTGFPLKLGLLPEDATLIEGQGLSGAFVGGTIWLHPGLLDDDHAFTGILEHELLHAKYAIISAKPGYRKHILALAGQVALDHLCNSEGYGDLLELYAKTHVNLCEEALVRAIENRALSHVPIICQAEKILKRPGGWNPLNLFRLLVWVPFIVWTRPTEQFQWFPKNACSNSAHATGSFDG
ncbi:hypothetical protein LOE14_20045 (plasmid) [Pseudosulfitobacter pseudonitzschiae]|nr:hypothetical protein [Pseudosulfitobacter pseudonitzschiae]MBM1854016.1 hypothetical protein [Pseudosulfitobacter pseudonitzschiae]MBM1883083.1 hypothetical protein [Pseudosulfitobacter pseudonitzschiae]MBM1936367.1 hypothetical protein [Pseudosulfitobacter pseudonitzschiae]MBM2008991.1 hypothetical protein [Pseudosulfitobacter pseudonitzschiae]MBM2042888.1 hypothetical protein [Pseudosulfitobacter pseudonitzschiae]